MVLVSIREEDKVDSDSVCLSRVPMVGEIVELPGRKAGDVHRDCRFVQVVSVIHCARLTVAGPRGRRPPNPGWFGRNDDLPTDTIDARLVVTSL